MGVWDVPAVFLPTSYAKPIVAAGASVVVLPPQEADPDAVPRILDGLDGLCVSGGYDVDPSSYGQPPHRETDAPRRDRDEWEFALLAAALEREMPVLGVCRGAQVLNVLRGGSLHQHLPDVVGSPRHQGRDGVFATIPVSVVAWHPSRRASPDRARRSGVSPSVDRRPRGGPGGLRLERRRRDRGRRGSGIGVLRRGAMASGAGPGIREPLRGIRGGGPRLSRVALPCSPFTLAGRDARPGIDSPSSRYTD